MCIAVFMWKSHPRYPLLLLLNRDEYYNRPTTPLGWWEDGEILGGRDVRGGGTWLACTRNGRLAFLTNVREIGSNSTMKTRGDLPVRFLKSQKSPKDFAAELEGEADGYNGFNLVVADLVSMTMVYITNRTMNVVLSMEEVPPGIHVLSNAKLNTPWPKVERLRNSFGEVVGKCLETEISLQSITEILMNDTRKDDENQLPRIYSPEFEYHLSSIFVEADTPSGRYGTRSTSAVVLSPTGDVSIYERNIEEDVWKNRTINYQIQT